MAGEQFKVGAVSYPLPTGTARSLLYDADPALYFALAMVTAALDRAVGPRLVEACQGMADPGNPKAGLQVHAAVGHATHLDPGRAFFDKPTFRWPLLAIYRTTTTFAEHTVVHERADRRWGIAYVLPAMTWQQQEKVVPILHAVENALMVVLHRGFDPAYATGARIWDDAHGGVQSVRLMSGAIGVFETPIGFPHPAWTGVLEVRERTAGVDASLPPFEGASVELGAFDQDHPDDDETFDVALDTDVTPPDPG